MGALAKKLLTLTLSKAHGVMLSFIQWGQMPVMGRRTNADKRRAVETLLNDPEWAKWSDREIARQCGVSNDFVSRLRPAICHSMTDSPRVIERNGTTYTMNTSSIGQRQAEEVKGHELLDGLVKTRFSDSIFLDDT